MTPAELKLWRKRHGKLSQTALAERLGVHLNTVNRWETGATEIPGFLHLALETLERHTGAPPANDRHENDPGAMPDGQPIQRAAALLEAKARIRQRYGVSPN